MLIVGGLVAVAAGCRTDADILMLRRELRWQEDRIYELQDDLCEMEDRLVSSRQENSALRRRLGAAEGTDTAPRTPGSRSSDPTPRGISDLPNKDNNTPPELNGIQPPQIDLGTPSKPEDLPAPKGNEPRPMPNGASRRRGASRTMPAAYDQTTPRSYDQVQIERIAINPRLTGGNNTDGHYGDEGVMVALEPRDRQGQLINAPGELTLTIIDAAESGVDAIVAEWDFAADDMAVHFRNAPFGKGFIFELPWPGEPPRRDKLKLRVRYGTPDGRTVTAEHVLRVEIGERAASRPRERHADHDQPTSVSDRPAWRPYR
jgi:hypothetical protein